MASSFRLWCDFIERDFLETEFLALVDSQSISGATSNPSIFAQSFQNPTYKTFIESLKGLDKKGIYEALAIKDIQRAAEILKPLWENNPIDGLVSIEIDPFLCDDVAASINEGIRLYEAINMPNVMIKVPATNAGYEVMNALIQRGININATLIFSPTQAKACATAIRDGLMRKKYAIVPQAVISVFVSRFDRAVDSQLNSHLRAKMGIINAMECYDIIEHFALDSIRTLFASTGVKGGDLSQSYYIDSLILPHSVNTAPLQAIRAYIANKSSDAFVPLIDSQSRLRFWDNLQQIGIERDNVAKKLLDEGLIAFQKSFEDILRIL